MLTLQYAFKLFSLHFAPKTVVFPVFFAKSELGRSKPKKRKIFAMCIAFIFFVLYYGQVNIYKSCYRVV